jgi:hypothetical protein
MPKNATSFCFRLRFKMATGLGCGRRKKIQLTFPQIAQPVSLAAEAGTIEKAVWLVARSCGYASEQESRENGERLRTALILTGAINRRGVDCGFDRPGMQFSKNIIDAIRERDGVEMRGSMHGLDVFDERKVVHVTMNAKGAVQSSSEAFHSAVEDALRLSSSKMSERQQICAALINDSLFVPNMDVRFVMCVSAVEALCDQGDIDEDYRSLIDRVLEQVQNMRASRTDKKILSDSLRFQKKQSIRNVYMTKIRNLIGTDAAKQFDKMYQFRSKFVHDGLGRGKISEYFDGVMDIATKLLKADVIQSIGEVRCVSGANRK